MLVRSIKDCQNYDVNNLSRSEITSSGIPCCAMMVLVNVYARSSAVNASLYGMKCAYFVNLSLITRMLSYSTPVSGSFDKGSLTIKSSAIDDQAFSSIDGDYSFPYGLCRECLAFTYVS